MHIAYAPERAEPQSICPCSSSWPQSKKGVLDLLNAAVVALANNVFTVLPVPAVAAIYYDIVLVEVAIAQSQSRAVLANAIPSACKNASSSSASSTIVSVTSVASLQEKSLFPL